MKSARCQSRPQQLLLQLVLLAHANLLPQTVPPLNDMLLIATSCVLMFVAAVGRNQGSFYCTAAAAVRDKHAVELGSAAADSQHT
jgi:hypothetical protein